MNQNLPFHIPSSVGIIMLGVLWGAGFPAIKIVVTYLPPLGSAGVRYAIAGIIILIYGKVSGVSLLPNTKRDVGMILLIGTFMFGGYQAGIFLGTQYISGSVAAVVNTMSPIIAAIIAVPILDESRGFVDFSGFCFGIIGVLILSQPSIGGASMSLTTLGVGLVFLGTICFAVGSVTIQLFDKKMAAEAIQGWAMLTGAAVLFIAGFVRGEPVPNIQSLSPSAIIALLYITLISSAGGYLLYFLLVRQVGATETTVVAYLEPVSATLISVLFFNQVVSLSLIVGFIAVAAGFTLVIRNTIRQTVFNYRTVG